MVEGGGGQSPLVDGGHGPGMEEEDLETWMSLEVRGAAEDAVEEKIDGKTFQQKTRVMIQTQRMWMERR